ncbi:hypothetical protein [Adhaeribacter aquaticus]|uniref:hypothetical protein n=1 Tax=Adhaeribacter aquaticus TaxID=299567 RepID=UPI000478D134|nr:hypothetical protein [Adhaeribacter aquaticus]
MRKYLITVLTLSATLAWGQNPFLRNNIFFELGGNGVYGSLNYERQLTKQPGLSARFGIGTLHGQREGISDPLTYWLTIPVSINYLVNLKNNQSFIDAGLGATWTPLELYFKLPKYPERKGFINYFPSIGYRRYTSKNLMWRINFTPVFFEDFFLPWAGISIGKRF